MKIWHTASNRPFDALEASDVQIFKDKQFKNPYKIENFYCLMVTDNITGQQMPTLSLVHKKDVQIIEDAEIIAIASDAKDDVLSKKEELTYPNSAEEASSNLAQ